MVYGIGIDLVKISRMKDVVEKWGETFLNRVFTKGEISYCYNKKNPYLSLAVRFAAKEALIKAIGSKVSVSFMDIEVISIDSGRPFLQINGNLEVFFKNEAINNIHLSLSHEHEYGIACVVLEK